MSTFCISCVCLISKKYSKERYARAVAGFISLLPLSVVKKTKMQQESERCIKTPKRPKWGPFWAFRGFNCRCMIRLQEVPRTLLKVDLYGIVISTYEKTS